MIQVPLGGWVALERRDLVIKVDASKVTTSRVPQFDPLSLSTIVRPIMRPQQEGSTKKREEKI